MIKKSIALFLSFFILIVFNISSISATTFALTTNQSINNDLVENFITPNNSNAANLRYIPCPVDYCYGKIFSGMDIHERPRYKRCAKYPSTYQDVAIDVYYYDWTSCTNCAYSFGQERLVSQGSFICNH